MRPLRVAVVGTGYLGRFHAQKYAALPACELVAVVDARAEAREAVAAELRTRALADHRAPIGEVDAAIFLPYEHLEITERAEFIDNLLFELLERE